MKDRVLFGFEAGTGQPVYIRPWHGLFAGLSGGGKTSVVKSLLLALGAQTLVFETKETPGRKVDPDFVGMGPAIHPFLKGLVEVVELKDLLGKIGRFGMKREFVVLAELCKNAENLEHVYNRLQDRMAAAKKKQGEQWEKMVTLHELLGRLMEEVWAAKPTKNLSLGPGINVMDLRTLSQPFQELVIQSCAEHIRKNETGTVLVIDEAANFLPENGTSAAKRSVATLTSAGRSAENWVWMSTQAVTTISKSCLKNVGIWCLGRQKEKKEVQRTLEQLQVEEDLKPEPVEIMRLKTGYFYLSQDDWLKKVYALPPWLGPEAARNWALIGRTAPYPEPFRLPGGLVV